MRSCISARLRLLGEGNVLLCAKLSCAVWWGGGVSWAQEVVVKEVSILCIVAA